MDIAVITCPKEQVKAIADRLVACGVKGLWNYMGVELDYSDDQIIVENVHLGDSLMIMNCRICRNEGYERTPVEIDLGNDAEPSLWRVSNGDEESED